jgi:hypothetical protein
MSTFKLAYLMSRLDSAETVMLLFSPPRSFRTLGRTKRPRICISSLRKQNIKVYGCFDQYLVPSLAF